MNIETVKKLLNKIFLLIPALLMLFSFYLLLANGPGYEGTTQETWKTFWHIAYYIFLGSFIVLFVFFAISPNKSLQSFVSSYKFLLLGLILSMFSFAIVGVLTDLGHLVIYLMFQK